jgi:hypothetical protein
MLVSEGRTRRKAQICQLSAPVGACRFFQSQSDGMSYKTQLVHEVLWREISDGA